MFVPIGEPSGNYITKLELQIVDHVEGFLVFGFKFVEALLKVVERCGALRWANDDVGNRVDHLHSRHFLNRTLASQIAF